MTIDKYLYLRFELDFLIVRILYFFEFNKSEIYAF